VRRKEHEGLVSLEARGLIATQVEIVVQRELPNAGAFGKIQSLEVNPYEFCTGSLFGRTNVISNSIACQS
jgi:hypothetical protein